MSDATVEELTDPFQEALDRAEAALDGREDGEIPAEAAEEFRDSAEDVAAAVSEASMDSLLAASGMAEHEEVSAVDVPEILSSADPESVQRLHRLLVVASLGDAWPDDDDELAGRLESITGDGPIDGEHSRDITSLLSDVLSIGDGSEAEGESDAERSEGESEADATEADSEAAETDSESTETDTDSSGLPDVEGLLAELRGDVEGAAEKGKGLVGDADEEVEAEAAVEDGDEDDEDSGRGGRKRFGGSRGRFSTVPSSRGDMGKRKRFSTMKSRK